MNTTFIEREVKMKFLLILTVFFLSTSAQALTVCAGKTVHYTLDQQAYGIPPQRGMLDYTEFIAANGKLLAKRKVYIGQKPFWIFKIGFNGDQELYREDHVSSGFSIHSTVISVKKDGELIVSEPVTCTKSWILVP